jgi:hypothetical protein
MCGRVRLSSDVSEIRLAFRIPHERPLGWNNRHWTFHQHVSSSAPDFVASWLINEGGRLKKNLGGPVVVAGRLSATELGSRGGK